MTETSTSIESLPKNGVDNEKQSIDPLIEPTVAINIDEPVESPPKTAKRFSGILYAVFAAVSFTSSIFITKQLNVDLLDAVIPRFLLQTVTLIIYMKFIKHYTLYHQLKRVEIFVLIINVSSGVVGYFTFFLAYRYLPLSDLQTIRYTQVVWTAILTAILYREKPSIPTILAVLLTTIGVVLVAQPNFLFGKTKIELSTDSHQHLIGLLIALFCSIILAVMIISNKYLLTKYKTKQSLVMLQFTFASSCVLMIYLFYKYYVSIDGVQTLKDIFLNWKYFWASSACLLQIIASIFIQKAVKREHPSVFTIVQSSDILFSILLQNIFSPIKSNFLSLIGSILVLTSILIISGFKLINDRKNKLKM